MLYGEGSLKISIQSCPLFPKLWLLSCHMGVVLCCQIHQLGIGSAKDPASACHPIHCSSVSDDSSCRWWVCWMIDPCFSLGLARPAGACPLAPQGPHHVRCTCPWFCIFSSESLWITLSGPSLPQFAMAPGRTYLGQNVPVNTASRIIRPLKLLHQKKGGSLWRSLQNCTENSFYCEINELWAQSNCFSCCLFFVEGKIQPLDFKTFWYK